MATFYVAQSNGNNGNSGSSSSPWLTIGFGISRLSGGDTLNIRTGTYFENIQGVPDGISNSQRTTIQADTGHTVTLSSPSGSVDSMILVEYQHGYMNFKNMIIDCNNLTAWPVNPGYSDAAAAYDHHDVSYIGLELKNGRHSGALVGGSSILFQDCHIHNNGSASSPGNYDHGLYFSCSFSQIDHCIIHDNRGWGWQCYGHNACTNNIFSRNIIFNQLDPDPNNLGGGCTLTQGTSHLLINNLFYDCHYGVDLFDGSVKCYNNLLYNCDSTGIVNSGGTGTGKEIINNIVFSCNGTIDGFSGETISNNVFTDPSFVNLSGRDFHLTSNSGICINAGLSRPEITIDRDGNARVGNPDIGPYEFGTGITPPPVDNPPKISKYRPPIYPVLIAF